MRQYLYPRRFRVNLIFTVLLSLLGSSLAAFGQMQWNSYDASGNLITANVASGGDLASATSVTFTIPANTQMSFMTKSFTPIALQAALATRTVVFNVTASAGLTGVTQRAMGWGLFNSGGTAGLSDDVGYFGLWNGSTKLIETYDHATGGANLFNSGSPSTKLGQGTVNTGNVLDGALYTNQIQLNVNSANSGISEGTSSSSLAAAGLAMNGVGVTERVFTNPVIPPVGSATSFDEFGFMFDNTTASPITVTISGLTLGNTLTWDASKANASAPTDGTGFWSITNAAWSSGVNDSVWSPGYSAAFGSTNGTGGTVTVTDAGGEIVNNITFNAASSGGYNITGSSLILTNSPTITVASGVLATNSSQLGGTAFTKAGAGTLVLLPTVAATNSGVTTVNAGTLQFSSTSVNGVNGDLTVNSGAVALFAAGAGIPTTSRLFINGGSVTNIDAGSVTVNQNIIAMDNNGFIGAAIVNQLNVTNFDFRSGTEAFAKFPATMTQNFTVKSTAGTVDLLGRANSSGLNGIGGLNINAGTFICDYSATPPNNDTQGGAKYINTFPMTLAGGTVYQKFFAVASRTETVGGVNIKPGATYVLVTNNAGTYTFAQGALTRSVGGTVDYSVGGVTGTRATTTTANSSGILGGYATYAGSDWATGATVSAYSTYTVNPDPTTWLQTNNVSLSGNPLSAIPDQTNINTLKLTGSSAITLGGTTILEAGGLLVTGTGANSISGGTLEGASGADLIIHQYGSGTLTVSSTLADNGSPTALTESGTGKVVVNGTDNMTGNNYLNGGILEVSGLSELAAGSLVMNNGTLHYVGAGETSSRSIILNGTGGTIDVAGSATVTQTTSIIGGGGFNSTLTPGLNLGDWGGLTKAGSGTFVLANNNIYNGSTVVNNGVLLVDGTNSLTGTSGLTNYAGGGSFVVNGGTLGGTGLISGSVDVKVGGTLAPGNATGTFTLGNGLILENGSTNLFQIANGGPNSLLAVQGNLTIQPNSVLAVSVSGSAFQPSTNTLITYTGTLSGTFNPTVAIAGGTVNGSTSISTSTPGQINLVVIPQVVITSQPQDLTVSTNTPASFTVAATGSATIGYQWYYYGNSTNNTPVLESGATGPTFSIASADPTNSGLYAVVVSNSYNTVMSRFATLIVGNISPVLNGPFNKTVIQGSNVTFSATVVIANPYPTFQWQTNFVNVTGATSTNMTLIGVPAGFDGMTVSLIASNIAGVAISNATLSVIVPPAIAPQPTNITVTAGSSASFVSGASGVPLPTLQWFKNGVVITNQTNSSLPFASAQGSDIANYYLVAVNAAGSVTSSVVKLTVTSTTLASATTVPANNSASICYDTPLYITFNGPVSLVNSGSIRIYNINNATTPVDTINLSTNTVVISGGINITNNIQPHSLFSGDSQVINYFPVIITGNTAAIYPHGGVMTSNQTYYVTMDSGIVTDSGGAYFGGISATNAWQFTTKVGGPVNPTNMVVAQDNSGDFDTVQGAVDSVTPGNTASMTVNIHNGNYVEIVDISGKNNITFIGQSRSGTSVGYPNNNNLTGTTAARMAFKVNSSDIHLENLTIVNATPQGGSQAESLLIYNNGLRCVVDNCEIDSRQDTVLINANTSQGYFNNCRIVGNFDYVWGVGVGYFNNCQFHTLTNTLSGSYNLTAPRTATASSLSATTPWVDPGGTLFSAYGFTFVNCTFDEDAGVTGITLSDSNGTPGGLDSWVDCLFDTNAYITPSVTLSNQYVFWQYSNTNIAGTLPITFTNVQNIGVTNNDPRLLASTNVVTWFSGWSPQLLPYIITQPVSQTVNAGQNTSFSVGASGTPAPTYQWIMNGTNLPSQTAATLTFNNASGLNIGTYSVIVTNVVGGLSSTNVVLVVNPPTAGSTIAQPVIEPDGSVQFTLTGANGAAGFNYRVWGTTNIQLSPITSTWTLINNGVFGTSPTIVTDTPAGMPQRYYIITVP